LLKLTIARKQLGWGEVAYTLLAVYSSFCFMDSASIILHGCK